MAMEDSATDSCSSRAAEAAAGDSASSPSNSTTNTNASAVGSSRQQQQLHRHKLDAFNEILRRLKDSGLPEAQSPSFDDDLWAHFNRLPARYVLGRPIDLLRFFEENWLGTSAIFVSFLILDTRWM